MATLLDLAISNAQSGKGQPANSGGMFDVFMNMAKEERDKKRKQENVKQRLSEANQIMSAMSQMPDNSSVGRSNAIAGDEVKQRQAGITGMSNMVPTREVSYDQNGLTYKFGFKAASPAEQKSMVDMQRSQAEMAREEQKRNFLSSYINGDIDEGAFLKEAGNLSLTADDFEQATSARTRLASLSGMRQQQQIPAGYEAQGMTQDKFGNMVPSNITKQRVPTEQELVDLQLSKAKLAQATAPEGSTLDDKIKMAQLQRMNAPEGSTLEDRLKAAQLEQANIDIAADRGQMTPQDMDVPEGYRVSGYARDKFGNVVPKGVEPIPMSEIKAQLEMQEAQKTNELKTEATIGTAKGALDALSEIENGIRYFGAMGRVPSWATPMDYDKVNWEANIDKLTGQNVVNLISEMKSQSRTGATGFGQLNKGELKIIQDASMVLKKGMSEEDAARYIGKMKDAFQKIIDRERYGYEGEQVKNNTNVSRGTIDSDPLGIR